MQRNIPPIYGGSEVKGDDFMGIGHVTAVGLPSPSQVQFHKLNFSKN
jgi:hypothetical protein